VSVNRRVPAAWCQPGHGRRHEGWRTRHSAACTMFPCLMKGIAQLHRSRCRPVMQVSLRGIHVHTLCGGMPFFLPVWRALWAFSPRLSPCQHAAVRCRWVHAGVGMAGAGFLVADPATMRPGLHGQSVSVWRWLEAIPPCDDSACRMRPCTWCIYGPSPVRFPKR